MAERQYYLGIDAAKAWLEVGSWPGSERRRVADPDRRAYVGTTKAGVTLKGPKTAVRAGPWTCAAHPGCVAQTCGEVKGGASAGWPVWEGSATSLPSAGRFALEASNFSNSCSSTSTTMGIYPHYLPADALRAIHALGKVCTGRCYGAIGRSGYDKRVQSTEIK